MGSSSSTTSGSATIAWASFVRWRMPGREAADRPEASLVQTDEVEYLGGALAGGAGRQTRQLAEAGDDVGGRLVGGKAVVLGHEADVASHADRIVGDGPPHHLDRPGGGAQLTERQPQQRRLAGSVGADQPHGAAGDVDGQLIEREGAARVRNESASARSSRSSTMFGMRRHATGPPGSDERRWGAGNRGFTAFHPG